ncbi:hypothetical protein A2642_03390 [Candidatus Nomurabacteria bacterium RIFCSPHIGHO2_01_FULL_39_10]|uniref:Uncharacterized protein n=1 Tax=Candidatus Nomurabacteria bacterium RIFCSPHIGHO2_01_FULL_39_10 TaxID=1801733 RepID=A0A1F6V4D4_9BACT|nr:MAG: hypothetical protein A2642_03390 [Candidatus Nomurabacteria bacterium RIFCSPHIGHO2_01_FULL_39_10]
MIGKKIYSSVVALSVGMSGCYGSHKDFVRDQDSVLSVRVLDDEFEKGFQNFYNSSPLEQKILGSVVVGNAPCPPYLPNCGKKKEEEKTNEKEEVLRGRSPYENGSSGRSGPSTPAPSATVAKSTWPYWVAIGGGALAIAFGYDMTKATACFDCKSSADVKKPLEPIGYVFMVGGGLLVVGGIIGLAK